MARLSATEMSPPSPVGFLCGRRSRWAPRGNYGMTHSAIPLFRIRRFPFENFSQNQWCDVFGPSFVLVGSSDPPFPDSRFTRSGRRKAKAASALCSSSLVLVLSSAFFLAHLDWRVPWLLGACGVMVVGVLVRGCFGSSRSTSRAVVAPQRSSICPPEAFLDSSRRRD